MEREEAGSLLSLWHLADKHFAGCGHDVAVLSDPFLDEWGPIEHRRSFDDTFMIGPAEVDWVKALIWSSQYLTEGAAQDKIWLHAVLIAARWWVKYSQGKSYAKKTISYFGGWLSDYLMSEAQTRVSAKGGTKSKIKEHKAVLNCTYRFMWDKTFLPFLREFENGKYYKEIVDGCYNYSDEKYGDIIECAAYYLWLTDRPIQLCSMAVFAMCTENRGEWSKEQTATNVELLMQYTSTKEIPEGLQPSFPSGEHVGHLCNGPDRERIQVVYPKDLVMRYRVRRDQRLTTAIATDELSWQNVCGHADLADALNSLTAPSALFSFLALSSLFCIC